jgi:hypothetical protein
LGIIAVDSSGTFEEPPIWVVATKTVCVQKHSGLYLDESLCEKLRKTLEKNWREKVSAAFIFKSVEPLIKRFDVIQVDKDFQGWRSDYIERNVQALFGKKYYGQFPKNGPKIQFVPAKYSADVQHAHDKTQWARHGGLQVAQNPDLSGILQLLE